MDVVIVLFDGVTALDAVGPYEVLQRVPGVRVRFVGFERGAVRTDCGTLGLVVDATLEEIERADVLVVPGGWITPSLESNPRLLEWIRRIHSHTRWTASVCTGALLLGAAGLLQGVTATTHWVEFARLAGHGAVPVSRRVVEHGRIMTAAGVSAGIDMALGLAAQLSEERIAQAIQLGIEYDPQPPFDTGAPSKAPAALVEAVRRSVERQRDERS